MELKLYLAQLNGDKINDLSTYADKIFDILASCTDEHTEVILGKNWISMSEIPSLHDILKLENQLVKLGLVIEA